jgi:hypothetical protein
LLPILLLSACAGESPQPIASPAFDPIAFFTGRTQGHGRLKILFRAAQSLEVRSIGRLSQDGTLILDQRILREGHRPERRQWRIRRNAPATYVATLSSAEGPVAVSVQGNRLRLDFPMDGASAHQDIFLSPDGRSALNHMTLSKLGIPVAKVEERIEKSN